MSSGTIRQLFVGLPNSGKTTFLAALWHVAETGDIPLSLRVSQLHGERDHLNKIREQWLRCKPLERTTIPAERIVSLKLRSPISGQETELFLPDLSGETFNLHWKTRQWSLEFDRLASESQGCLLFVHPRRVNEPVRINAAIDRMASVIGETEEERDLESIPLPWDPDSAPTQVKLVELVQFLRLRPFFGRPLRIAVIVSAWDLVDGSERPELWLKMRLPLLHQYLTANAGELSFRVYGVSAQGGELSEAGRLQLLNSPSERIIITGTDAGVHDITAPIRWLMESQSE